MLTLDLVGLIRSATQLRKVSSTDGGEWAGACPWCGGGDRFRVWPDAARPRYWCRRCGRKGDAIQFLRDYEGMTYRDAAAVAGQMSGRMMLTSPAPIVDDAPPSPVWQERASELAAQAQEALWAHSGANALRYLREHRGLTDDTIRSAELGYNAIDLCEHPHNWDFDGEKHVFMPRGITIPGRAGGHLWYVKVRRPSGSPKYVQPRGSKVSLYGADRVAGRHVVVLAEGEFDALLLRQEAGDLVDVATMGSASTPLAGRWLWTLRHARRILVSYDLDAAGARGAQVLTALSARVRIISPPGATDISAAWQAGVDLRPWIRQQLDEHAASPTIATEIPLLA